MLGSGIVACEWRRLYAQSGAAGDTVYFQVLATWQLLTMTIN